MVGERGMHLLPVATLMDRSIVQYVCLPFDLSDTFEWVSRTESAVYLLCVQLQLTRRSGFLSVTFISSISSM